MRKASFNPVIYEDFLQIYIKGFEKSGRNHITLKAFNGSLFLKPFFMLRHLLAFLIKSISNKRPSIAGKLGYYAISQNTLTALRFLSQEKDSVLIYSSAKLKTPDTLKRHLPFKWKYSLNYFGVLYHFVKTKPSFALNYFDLIFYATGYFEYFSSILSKERPHMMVFSNDHNYDSRALLMACTKLNIKTVYIQHASVTNEFPSLSFDLNLLEGEDSLSKYKQCGSITGETHLIGMPKFDPYFKYIKPVIRNIKSIGLAFNTFDNLEIVRSILSYLTNQTDFQITVRPHPQESRNLDLILNINNLQVSGKNETAFDFIAKQDVLISGNSSILLEGVLLNIIPFYYSLNPEINDYYGFVKNKLAEHLSSIESINNLLNRYSDHINVRGRAKFYNATIEDEYDGKSELLALELIEQSIK